MDENMQQQILQTLREIRDGQRAAIELLAAQKTAAEEQAKWSRASITDSIALQRAGLRRQRQVMLAVVPAIAACLAAILYLVLRYF
jgi:hypothetical protein